MSIFKNAVKKKLQTGPTRLANTLTGHTTVQFQGRTSAKQKSKNKLTFLAFSFIFLLVVIDERFLVEERAHT
jgi:hypothetical protein